MKQWEDILKERLEGYESTLPEGSYAEFQRLREAGKAAPRKKGYPLVWAAAVAVAASLAAVFFLRQPALPEDGVQLVQQRPVEVQVPVADSLVADEPEVTATRLAQAAPVKALPAARPIITRTEPQEEPQIILETPEEVPNPVEETPEESPSPVEELVPETPDTEDVNQVPEMVQNEPFIPTGSPFIPENRPRKEVNLKVVVPVTGGVLGTGALALLASNMIRVSQNAEAAASKDEWHSVSDKPLEHFPSPDPGTNEPVERLLEYNFAFPLRLGLSARIPVWNHLYLNTGFEYSRYTSDLSFLLAGAKTQVVQYLGVPLRMDWVFPLGKWFDAYVGAGLQADFCVGATWNGDAIRRDKINLSLGTAAGIQINPRPHVGLFVEPQLSWLVPTADDFLLTYRNQHPWMFSVSAGVRINIVSVKQK